MKRSQSLFRPGIIVGIVIVVLLVYLIGRLVTLDGDGVEGPDSRSTSSPSLHESSTPAVESPPVSTQATLPSESVIPAQRLADLEDAVHQFVTVFYYRDVNQTEDMLRQKLAPLVTRAFLRETPTKLSTESDDWVREHDGTIEASAVIRGGDAAVSAKRASVDLDVTLVGTADSASTSPYTFLIRLEMVWSDGWRVAKLS